MKKQNNDELSDKVGFQEFTKAVNYWTEYYGLKNYEVVILHEKLDEDVLAQAIVDSSARVARILFTNDLSDVQYKTKEVYQKAGFHEIWEVILWDVRIHLSAMFSHEYINEMIHVIIKIQENSAFKVI